MDSNQRKTQTLAVGDPTVERLYGSPWSGQRCRDAGVLRRVRRQIHENPRRHQKLGRSARARRLRQLRGQGVNRALLFMVAMVFGHFAIIPLLSPYLVYNVGLPEGDLFLVYFTGGVLTVFTAPLIGKLADRLGRFRVFASLVGVASVVTLFITHSGRIPAWAVLVSGAAFFVFAGGRFV